MLIGFFKSIPPGLSVPAFYTFLTLGLLLRFLFASVVGVLMLAFAMYAYVDSFSDVEPYGPVELLNWYAVLGSDYKVALLGALVTVAGFAIAFHTATVNWRNQMKAQLQASAAGEIENFFALATRNLNTASLYIEHLIEIINEIQGGCTAQEVSFRIGFAQGQMNEFVNARNMLSQASIEVHRLIGKNHNLLASSWGLLANAREAAEALSNVAEHMWITLPIVDLNDPNHIQQFINLVNVTECQRFVDTCELNATKISTTTGGIRGYLISPVIGFSLSMYIYLLRSRREMTEVASEIYKIHKI